MTTPDDLVMDSSYRSDTSLTPTSLTFLRSEKQHCCRCVDIRIGIFLLGLWSIIITIGYYIGFLMLYQKDVIRYPVSLLYCQAVLGFIGGSSGILAAIFKNKLFSQIFLFWAIIRFVSQFAEGLIYAISGHSVCILSFIDFIVWGYFIIVIYQYTQLSESNTLKPMKRLMSNNTICYHSTSNVS